jgi:hypothetical protein
MSRLDMLVCVLAPVTFKQCQGQREFTDDEWKDIAEGTVKFAVLLDRALADEELKQMRPPPGMGG